jgi:cytochrome o ubiquinol oxidase operon protein cyoD
MEEPADRQAALDDRAPGVEQGGTSLDTKLYTVGLVLAMGLTLTSFWTAGTSLIWAPGVAVGLTVLAIAQIGVHLVFFLRMSTGPDHTNNVLALAFGVLIVTLVISGSLWIMTNLNANMMAMPHQMEMQP